MVVATKYKQGNKDGYYDIPGGKIEEEEFSEQTAIREMKEETGLSFIPAEGVDPGFTKPYFLGAGLTDETSTSVFGYADGGISTAFAESTETIEVLTVDKKEAVRILREEKVSLRAAFLLIMFLQQWEEDPFAFLKNVTG